MVTRLKLISGYNKFLAVGLLILVCLLIMPGTNVLAQIKVYNVLPTGGGPAFGFSGGEVIDENSIGGGPSFGFSTSEGIKAYRFGLSKSYFPDFDLGIAVNKYEFSEQSYYSISSGLIYFPIRYYNNNTRVLLSFNVEYERSFENVRQDGSTVDVIESYQLRGSFFLGSHNIDRSTVLLPYLTYGTINTTNITDRTYDVLGVGLIFGHKIGKSDTFFVFSLGATYYNDKTLIGVKIGYVFEKDYITTNHLE